MGNSHHQMYGLWRLASLCQEAARERLASRQAMHGCESGILFQDVY